MKKIFLITIFHNSIAKHITNIFNPQTNVYNSIAINTNSFDAWYINGWWKHEWDDGMDKTRDSWCLYLLLPSSRV